MIAQGGGGAKVKGESTPQWEEEQEGDGMMARYEHHFDDNDHDGDKLYNFYLFYSKISSFCSARCISSLFASFLCHQQQFHWNPLSLRSSTTV